MNRLLLLLITAVLVCLRVGFAQTDDPAHVDVYITPYYNSVGPTIDVGAFSKGLASTSEKEFVATVLKMKQSWEKLSFPEVYVAAIRLYDLGYRKEAVYWFYSAQYRYRLFKALLDEGKMGSIGDLGFELIHAGTAFHQLVGPYINGYAFGDTEHLATVIQKVQKEGRTIPDLKIVYENVKFKSDSEWKVQNMEVNDGLTKLLTALREQGDTIKQQRVERGIEAKFSKLPNKELSSGSTQGPTGAVPQPSSP